MSVSSLAPTLHNVDPNLQRDALWRGTLGRSLVFDEIATPKHGKKAAFSKPEEFCTRPSCFDLELCRIQNCEKINTYCVSYSTHGIFLCVDSPRRLTYKSIMEVNRCAVSYVCYAIPWKYEVL